jgi:hypothetical protein
MNRRSQATALGLSKLAAHEVALRMVPMVLGMALKALASALSSSHPTLWRAAAAAAAVPSPEPCVHFPKIWSRRCCNSRGGAPLFPGTAPPGISPGAKGSSGGGAGFWFSESTA